MVNLLSLALARRLARHRWQTLLSALGVALGVGVVVAVDLANHSARKSFETSLQQIAGRATHHIIGARDLDESLYATLHRAGVRHAAPLVEGRVKLRGETFQLLGIAPLAEINFRAFAASPLAINSRELRELFTRAGSVLLSKNSAARLKLNAQQNINIKVAGVDKNIFIAGLLADAPDGLLLADIATAQQLLGRIGKLDRIDLILNARAHEIIAAHLPAHASLVAPDSRNRARADLGKPFQTNLAAMSMLALLVGGFLIHNAMRFSTLQRRELLGHLRMLGATRAQLFTRMLMEAIALGLAGAIAGLIAGVWLARGLLDMVARTINDLYFSSHGSLLLPPQILWKGLALGLGVTLIAALLPAWEAARAPPQLAARRSLPEQRARRELPKWACAGGGLVFTAAVLAILPGDALLPGFIALFCLLIGFCLATPLLALMLSQLCAPIFSAMFGFSGRYALRGVGASLSRTGPALAALTLALAATIGVGVMVKSFRGAVEDWLDKSLPGDVYISIPANASARESTALPAALMNALREVPGVAALSAGRRIEVETSSGAATLHAIAFAQVSRDGFHFTQKLPDVWENFSRGKNILISEPFAFHRNLRAGDELDLLSANGMRKFRIGGIFRDYGSESGAILIARAEYIRNWRDAAVSTIGVYFSKNNASDASELRAAINMLATAHDSRIRMRANFEIRMQSLRVFERTFAITRVLRWLVITVAFVGIFSALLALQFERARENAVLRACGCTRLGVFSLGALQSGVIGLFAGLLAIPLGWLIAQLLVRVINPRSFGWTLPSLPASAVYVEALALGLIAAALAGLYPGWRAAHASPAAALREE